MPPMTSPADLVRKAIATPSSCAPTTSTTLQALLAPAQDPTAKPTKTAAKTTTRRPAPTRTTRTKTAPNAAPDATTTLTVLERYKLATEVVNVSLKVLTDATKTSPSSPSLSPKPKKTALSGLTSVAECARIAFAHLRSARSATDESLQLEKGMLALSSKLVALGMDTLAMKELRMLKACLHKRSEGANLASTSEKETLATLLSLECRTVHVDVMSLAISYHLTVLRLIANSGPPATIEASLPHLLLDNDISPASLILRCAEQTKDRTKAATQLDTVSRLILSMCPSPSASMDHDAQSFKTCASPHTVFQLQSTALLIQKKWWPLAGHKADLSKELHEPLVRFLDAYRRRVGNEGLHAYNEAVNAVAALVDLDQKKASVTNALPIALYRSLSALAESFGMQDEALRYTESMSLAPDSTTNSSSMLLFRIRSLALGLHRDAHLDPISMRNQLKFCSSAVKDDRPTTLSMDDLLVELTKLRKITIKLLTPDLDRQTTTEIDQQLSTLCEIACLCTTILLWCVKGTDSKERADVTSKLVSPFVSSSIYACKSLVSSHDHIEVILDNLEVCTQLIDLQSDSEAEHLVVNISNLLWRCFQLLNTASEEPSVLAIRCLQASVDVLRNRSPVYQEAGFLAAKLEKLGSVSKSCSTFAESIRVRLQSGVLRDLNQEANQKPLSIILQTHSKAQLLKRHLHEYHTIAAKDSENISFFDDESMDRLERAALLEIQLALFEEDLFKPSHRRRITTDLQQLCNRILEIYDANAYPLRQARVCARVLRYSNEFPGLIGEKTKKIAMTSQIVDGSLGQDHGLEPYAVYLRTSLSLTQAFQAKEASVEDITKWTKALSLLSESTADWKSVVARVDDVDILVSELQFAATFLGMKGKDGSRLEALQALSHIHHLRPTPERPSILHTSSQLALQYLRLGYSTEACRIIDSEDSLSSVPDVPVLARLEWHLAKTETLTALGRIGPATKSMISATECMRSFPAVDHTTKLHAQILRAQFAFVCSLYSRSIGQVKQAMVHAKRYVSACQGTLSFLEAQYAPQADRSASLTVTSQEELVTAVDKLVISDTGSETTSETFPSTRRGAGFSLIVPHLLNSFLHLSDMYAHQGLRPEAMYYLDQADNLLSRVGVPELRTRVLVQRQAQAYIEGIESDNLIDEDEFVDSIDLVKLGITRGNIYAIDEETWEAAQQEYEKAGSMASRLASKSFVDKLEPAKSQSDKAPVTNTTAPRITKRAATKGPAVKASLIKAVKPTSTKFKATAHAAVSNQDNVPLSSLCAAALRQRGLLLLNQGETDLGLELLKRADSMKYDSTQEVLQQLAMAEGLLRKFGDELALDFTFNVLPESTISLPALSTSTGKKISTQVSLPSSSLSPSTTTTPKKINRQKRADDEFAQFLCEAQERLVAIQRRSATTAGMSVFHQLCGLGSKAMLLLSAINASLSLSGALHPTRAACSIEMSRIEAASREICTVEAEKDFTNHDLAIQYAAQDVNGHLSAARFQREYVDVIPSSWTAVSLTLSEDHNELYIVRYRANQAPFLLRLPMTRNKMQDIEGDEESPTFDFESGKAELQEIIELSNYTCSKPPSAMTPEAKNSWWEEREALDLRMQELIVNIESIWLGGFKGVLSQHRKDSALLARFRKSLDGILDRHLPSRQGTKSKAKKLVLDANIVELFVGLGDDHDGEVDMDEQVLDLLYFVIDILQFNGERNAYDEVDFDVMATETMDALRSYHEAANFNEADQNHLILILDRKLHAFPWESMPCLQNVSVSRVGSMLTLRERILAMRRQRKDNTVERYFVNKQSGASILNPSGDLSRTQTTMAPLLDSLTKVSGSAWQSINNRAPTEKEFATALSEKNMMLYFGHGSGSQYICKRTIKKLDKCAEVVWLMGCSSGSVTEYGDFEPTSVPLSYLIAGKRLEDTHTDDEAKPHRNDNREGLCMAVVATLWDVTDKDIDRFSVKLGEQWGLWSSTPAVPSRELAPPKTPRKRGRSVPKTPSKTPSRTPGGRSRSRLVMRDEEGDRKNSLAEAVMLSRDACTLRYLNGAATVVYGVPVYLG
ncbi:hypothetical protein D6D12_10694 [Aureobasidium pullulans]|uniref:separase n=1 Tax=Aureobasidium pullulans TaxID=5580 RepID=A0AB74JDK0_AURPU|nr:hypothetical protein D6D12_10694 [Aureobasidium pullulans]THX38489.1 hypothetical protein D6D11_09035 [Aureobasidium pullulans]